MILDTTYKTREIEHLINDLVGKSFNFIKIFKMNGTGSKQLIIEEASSNMDTYLNTPFDATFVNIELRPLGILAKINKVNKSFTWVIPYYQLDIDQGSFLSIQAQNRYIKFRDDQIFQDSKAFFDKLLEQKYGYETNYGTSNYDQFTGRII
jgi:hypothetical protein